MMFSTALIIVWREGVEALLIVGILYAWLRRYPAPQATAYLGAGIAAGLCCAVALLAGCADTAVRLACCDCRAVRVRPAR